MFRKIKLAFILTLLSTITFAQTSTKSFLGSKTLYKPLQSVYTPTPKGFEPVFINHLGRHGARHLTKDVAVTLAYKLIAKADSLNELSAKGQLLKQKVWKLQKVELENFESISEEGREEQFGIAERMYSNFSPVFSGNPVINVAVTKKIRTTQTSEAFLETLKPKVKSPQITSAVNDTTLRFYDLSPTYLEYDENGSWIQLIDQLKTEANYEGLIHRFTKSFFKPAFYKKLTEKDYDKFTSDIFGFATIFYSIQKEIIEHGFKPSELDMTPFFTCAELTTIGKIDDAEDFLVKGPAMDANGIQVKIAVPLLADFINTTDDFIQSKKINAQLRFSHAEAIAPFAAILDIKGASASVKNIKNFSEVWDPAKVMQLSSNVQWILYKQKGIDNYLIKFLLNEKEAAINGLATNKFPYYNWKDVRAFYKMKIEKSGSSLEENGYYYLQNVK